MKISKALRREAIEFAGCMAAFWADETLASSASYESFTAGSQVVGWEAWSAAANSTWPTMSNEDAAHRWAEAQAMLLDGWTP